MAHKELVHRLTTEERTSIIELHATGMAISDIANRLRRARETVRTAIREHQERMAGVEVKHAGSGVIAPRPYRSGYNWFARNY